MFVSRGEMAVTLIKAMALKGKFDMSFAYPAAPFYTDVPAGHPQFPYIQKLKQQGITGGTSASTYSPLDPLQRFMMAAFLVRAFFTEP
jgi:hypothetical protein